MRIRYAALLAPVALTIACSDEGPIQNTGPKLTISPATVSVETGADAITLQAVPQNGDLTGSVTWSVLSGSAGTLGQSSGTTNTFTPSDLGTAGGAVVIKATATVGGGVQPATSAVTVVPSTRGRIALGIDPGQTQAVGGACVDISELDGGSKVTFTASAPTVLRSRIIDAGSYVVTADAGIVVPGNLVDGTWDGTVTFDGGTPARSVQVPVTPNLQTNVLVTFALRGGLGRMWVPAGGGILGYTETELLVDHASQTGLTAAGARAVAFDADGNLWATFSDGVRMYPPGALSDPNAQPTKTVTLANATGIAIRGATVAVGICSGSNGGVSTFTRTDATPTAMATPISVGLRLGSQLRRGEQREALGGVEVREQGLPLRQSHRFHRPRRRVPHRRVRHRGGRKRQRLGEQLQRQLGAADQRRGRRRLADRAHRLPVPGWAGPRQAGHPLGPLGWRRKRHERQPGLAQWQHPQPPAQLADAGAVRRDRLRSSRGHPARAPVARERRATACLGHPCPRADRGLAVQGGKAHLVCTMPGRAKLPSTLKRSPPKAQRTYEETLEHAEQQYGDDARAHRTAFAVLKRGFEKVRDRWLPKKKRGPSDPRSAQELHRGQAPGQGGDLRGRRRVREQQAGADGARPIARNLRPLEDEQGPARQSDREEAMIRGLRLWKRPLALALSLLAVWALSTGLVKAAERRPSGLPRHPRRRDVQLPGGLALAPRSPRGGGGAHPGPHLRGCVGGRRGDRRPRGRRAGQAALRRTARRDPAGGGLAAARAARQDGPRSSPTARTSPGR